MYPLTGQTTFLLGSPWFRHVEIALDAEGTRKIKITSTVSGNSENEGYHVQRVWLNGQLWEKSWLEWSDLFVEGGTLDFELDATPRAWAMGPTPPSPASEGEGAHGGDSGGVAGSVADHGTDHGDMALMSGGVGGLVLLLLVVVVAYLVSRKKRMRKHKQVCNEMEMRQMGM